MLNRGEAIVAPRGRADHFLLAASDIQRHSRYGGASDAVPPKGTAANSGAEDGKKNTDKAATTKSSVTTADSIVMSTPIGGVRATRKVNLRMAISLTEDELRLLKQLEAAAEHGRTEANA